MPGRAFLGFTRADVRMLGHFLRMMLVDRFLGSKLGMIWLVANPILMLAIFTFVFGFVFKSRLPGAETSLSYVIWLISGYGPWLAISEGLQASTSSLLHHTGLLKNLKFKAELLPMAGALTGVTPLIVCTAFLAVLLAVGGRGPAPLWLLLLPLLIMQFLLVMGAGFVLAAANVFVRDIGAALPNVLLIVMFATPIFYPLSMFPEAVQRVMLLNPIYQLSEACRLILVEGKLPPFWWFVYLAAVSGAAFALGLLAFRRVRAYIDAAL